MKEYTITMNFIVESEKDYDEMNEFAEQLVEDMLNNDKLTYRNGAEITEISIHSIEGDYEDDDNIYLQDDDE
jgi:hypothetical protein